MSRLLFAAARKARIERAYFKYPTVWEQSRLLWAEEPTESDYNYRIHPDDAHLEYGPISTAVRKRAETGSLMPASLPYLKGDFFLTHEETLTFLYDETFDMVFFLLIVAEALADEGL